MREPTLVDTNVKSNDKYFFHVQVCCFFGFVISVAWQGYYSGGHKFFVFMSFVTFMGCLVMLTTRAIKLDDLLNRDINWVLMVSAMVKCKEFLPLSIRIITKSIYFFM